MLTMNGGHMILIQLVHVILFLADSNKHLS